MGSAGLSQANQKPVYHQKANSYSKGQLAEETQEKIPEKPMVNSQVKPQGQNQSQGGPFGNAGLFYQSYYQGKGSKPQTNSFMNQKKK